MTNRPKAIILGCAGTALTPEEDECLRKWRPLGLILFKRNIESPKQVRALGAAFRDCVGRENAPILVDQEGGLVQRLRAPNWTELPAVRTYEEQCAGDETLWEKIVAHHAEVIALNLKSAGITTDCWPCLDVACQQTHSVMASRCFSTRPERVARLAEVAVRALLQQGIMPVVKHLAGYGRAVVDPHKDLPVVEADLETLNRTDFVPFRQMRLPVWGMTAHIIYRALDPERPATLSPRVMNYIRQEIGFDGFVISDAMEMGALTHFGTPAEIADGILRAGCDAVLHCTGVLTDVSGWIDRVPEVSDAGLKRLQVAEELLKCC